VFGKTSKRAKVPWLAIVVCAACWALCLGLGFRRLVTLDIMLYGASLMLEFVTLVVLRVKEPNLKRGFRVPGGMTGAIICGIFPLLLLLLAVVESNHETVLGINGLLFGTLIILAGVAIYFVTGRHRRVQTQSPMVEAVELG